MRCLVVDDDEYPRQLIGRMIANSGHSAVAVADGNAAIEALLRGPFDIAIVDMEMPKRGGAATIAALRAIDPDIRVLVVSGHDDRRHVMAAIEAGADGYLVKDEISSSLASSLQSIRAGHTPLSPRVASVMIRQLRKQARPVGKVNGIRLPRS